MKKVEWTDSLNLGVKLIDEQHRELIRIVNQLLQAIHDKDNETTVKEILGKLREYTVFHFNAEERFMNQIRYPGRGEQQQQHERLKRKVKGFQHACFHHEEVTFGELKAMLSEWLLEHILNYDMEIANFLREREKEGDESKGQPGRKQTEENPPDVNKGGG